MILVWSSPLTVTMSAYRYRVEAGRIVGEVEEVGDGD